MAHAHVSVVGFTTSPGGRGKNLFVVHFFTTAPGGRNQFVSPISFLSNLFSYFLSNSFCCSLFLQPSLVGVERGVSASI